MEDALGHPPGLISNKTRFGLPAPRTEYYEYVNNKRVLRKPSYWVYPNMTPQKGDVGITAEAPNPTELPLKATECNGPQGDISTYENAISGLDPSDDECESTYVIHPPTSPNPAHNIAPVPSTFESHVRLDTEVVIGSETAAEPLQQLTPAPQRNIFPGDGDRSLWSKKGPYDKPRKTPWRFSSPDMDSIKFYAVLTDGTTAMRSIHVQYAPLLAYLDLTYRASIIDSENNVRLGIRLSHYLNGLRAALEEELFQSTPADELVKSSWRSQVLHEWSTRTFLWFGHSDTGRTLYLNEAKLQGIEPYQPDPLQNGGYIF